MASNIYHLKVTTMISRNVLVELKKLVIYLSLGEVKNMRTLEVTIRHILALWSYNGEKHFIS